MSHDEPHSKVGAVNVTPRDPTYPDGSPFRLETTYEEQGWLRLCLGPLYAHPSCAVSHISDCMVISACFLVNNR